MPAYHAYRVDNKCYVVVAKDHGCITSIALFVAEAPQLQTYVGRLEQNLAGELLVKYPAHLLQSNSVPADHDEIHNLAGEFANTPPEATKDTRHWHWSVNAPSKSANQTVVVYLNAVGLGSHNDLFPLLG